MFHAERILGGDGKVYHKKCAHCAICEKPLNSMTLCNGKDGDIYCKSCYARKFGAPGYRGECISLYKMRHLLSKAVLT